MDGGTDELIQHREEAPVVQRVHVRGFARSVELQPLQVRKEASLHLPRAPDKVRVNVNTGESATGAIVHKDGDLKDRPTRVPWFVPFDVGNLP